MKNVPLSYIPQTFLFLGDISYFCQIPMSSKSQKKNRQILLQRRREKIEQYRKLEDEQLLSFIFSSERNVLALRVLIERYQSKVIGIVYPYVKNDETAKDIFRETLLRVFLAFEEKRYEEKGNFGAWIIQIAKNLATDYVRKQQRNREIPVGELDLIGILSKLQKRGDAVQNEKDEESSESDQNVPEEFILPSLDEINAWIETRIKLREAIKQLPDKQREAIILRYYHGKKFKDIAEMTGVNINTALARVRYGLIHLRKLLQNEG